MAASRCLRYLLEVLVSTNLYFLPILLLRGGSDVRDNGLKLSILALVIAATLATVPAASANSIVDDIFVGGTQIGTPTLTQGGTCNGMSISSSSVCVDIQMTSGTV